LDITHNEFITSYASCYANSGEHQREDEIIPKGKFVFANNNIHDHIDWHQEGGLTNI
jgi:hypothetical protein